MCHTLSKHKLSLTLFQAVNTSGKEGVNFSKAQAYVACIYRNVWPNCQIGKMVFCQNAKMPKMVNRHMFVGFLAVLLEI